MFFCYILESTKSGRFYVGHAEDLERRLVEHNNGRVVATRNKGPWEVVVISLDPKRLRENVKSKAGKMPF